MNIDPKILYESLKLAWLSIGKFLSSFLVKNTSSIVILRENTQFPELTAWWHMGTNNGKQGMQIVGSFLVTNISEKDVLLTGAKLKKSKARGEIFVKELDSKDHSAHYLIPSGHSTKMSIHFWIEPPLKNSGEIFIDNIAVFDQRGKKHWIKKVSFRCV